MRQLAGVDVGGTFTDVVILEADGRPRATKVPTTPDDQAEAVVRGLAAMAGGAEALVGHGTTTATNAILEGSTGGIVLVTTDGFSGLLAIGRQDRPSLYDLGKVRPRPLVPHHQVVTVRERTGADGRVLVELTEGEVARVAEAVAGLRPRSVAISLLFSFADPTHEERLETAIRRRLDVPVTRSSRLLPEFREYERASTCVLNAALAPVMDRYLAGLGRRLGGSTVWVMTSSGGTASLDFAAEAPVHTLLSGPAAGVVAAAAVARGAGFDDAVALDMGGTSTDACLIRDGRPEVLGESQIAGFPFRTPAVAVHTVGAGGGSVAWLDEGGALRVGPRSAGSRPGPACYGRGGTEPTVTDAHCALGHLDPERPLGGLQLDPEGARRALATLPSPAGGAEGILQVVRATMARALRRVTTERGVSPSGLALVAYGGAGPLHATTLARELGCRAVIVPPAPGVFSALGLLLAAARYEASRTVLGLDEARLPAVWQELGEAAREELHRQGAERPIELTRFADCRYPGQSHELRVKAAALAQAAASFHEAHRLAYGYALSEETVEVVTLRVVAQGSPHLAAPPTIWDHGPALPERKREVRLGGEVLTARVVDRAALSPGDVVRGPAVVEQADATTLLLPDDTAVVDQSANLLVRLRD
ncbi:MAG: hydantoinase/oxoprolinase family protein [Acidimicrobiia bacterium]